MKFIAMETSKAEVYRNGSADAYGQPPEISISDGGGYPCRHCLNDIPNGKHMLLLAYRPVDENQPYAETGPVFLCADPCRRFDESAHLPPAIARRKEFIVRGYSKDNRIIDGTGSVISTSELEEHSRKLLQDPRVETLHIRSASNNCYFCAVLP